ncbi:MAG TPA: hypothetical protein VJT14_09255 [Candidatus Dormibacteraeota bacterium]|nr:hypothetical protein [Candidatus Dormibacteraeota bacterium]
MSKRATLGAIVLIGILTAACTSSQAGLRSRPTSNPNGSAVAATAAPGSLATPQREAAPTQGQPLAQPPVKPNLCPPITANPITANPIGCPGPLPPQPIVPPAGHARILLCPQPIVAGLPPIPIGAMVCGAGFRPEEVVTITVKGRIASTSWQVAARPDGTFRSGLPPTACRLMPAYMTARGNRGSVSNVVPLFLVACRRIP